MMHPKNHQRRESVANKTYIEIVSVDDSTQYLAKILTLNLKNEIFLIFIWVNQSHVLDSKYSFTKLNYIFLLRFISFVII